MLSDLLRYVKSGSKALLSIQYIKGLHVWQTLDKVDLDFSLLELKPEQIVTQTSDDTNNRPSSPMVTVCSGQNSVATIKLSIGQPKSV